jgi:acetylornithine deacetylase/succinyl-diaminopimelate desuccinylase-like protein
LRFKSKELGNSTLNVSSVNGGLLIGKEGNHVLLDRQGNIIPDYCEFTIEVRTAHPKLNAVLITKKLEAFFKKKKITVLDSFIKHDLGALITSVNFTKQYEKFIPYKTKYLDGKLRGYGDGQMLAEKLKIPVCYLGPTGEYPHGDNEYVEIDSLEKLKDIYKKIIYY